MVYLYVEADLDKSGCVAACRLLHSAGTLVVRAHERILLTESLGLHITPKGLQGLPWHTWYH